MSKIDINIFDTWIKKSKIEKKIPLFPIQEKYIRYRDIQSEIVPTIVKIKNHNYNSIIKNLNQIIKEHELLRCIFNKEESSQYYLQIYEYQSIIEIPQYECSTQEEFEKIVKFTANHLINKPLLGNVPYIMSLVKFKNEIYFLGIFSHLIFDGGFDFEKYLTQPELMPKSNFEYFQMYVNSLPENKSENFSRYFEVKRKFTKNYLSYNVQNDYISIDTDLLFRSKKVTIEELWIIIINQALHEAFSEFDVIPLNVLTNGRKYGDLIASTDFGDFHDEITLITERRLKEIELVKKYRNYRKTPFLNSKSYSSEITGEKEESSLLDREPIILLIGGNSPEVNAHSNIKKLLPPRKKSYVLSIKVLVNPNLRNYTIYFRYSNLITREVDMIKKYIMNLGNDVKRLNL